MVTKVTLDEQLLNQLQQAGELQVEDSRGLPIVLMTVGARRQLQPIAYDAGEWSPEEMLSVASKALADPEGWGSPGMDDYDKVYGNLFEKNDQNP